VDALYETMPLATHLFGICSTGIALDVFFAKPFNVASVSSLPRSVALPANLGIAGNSETAFVSETGAETNLTLTSSWIQGLPGGPTVTCSNNTVNGWWVFLNAGTLSYASACDAGTVSDFITTGNLMLTAGTRLTARDPGGVVVVAPNGSQVAGVGISPALTVGTAATLSAPFSPADVQIGTWGPGTTVTRVVMLDGANGQAFFIDLTTAASGAATWTPPVLPAGPPGAVFAAPMYPNMLFEVDDAGTPRIAWLPP
jgi:hypothetical protein